ncbi:hypothetical protein NDU88_006425 [Pleurodeles waltl]|uniref:Uncharacterized protein n=1 Tax=Pleurodeles waltl TaxID=8319 RepID=A0AAV7SPT4_PLEWA|nr:hypothetical protein NDU88_006425 [Pleurodeles waltl]
MVAMSAVVPLSEHVAGLVAVLAAVSVAAVLAVVHGSAPAEGHSRTSPAASDGCPTGKRLRTVAEVVDVPVAVQVAGQVAVVVEGQLAVLAAVQVGVVMDRRCYTGPSVGATVPSPDLLFCFCPVPTFDGAAVVLPLSPFVFAEPLVAGSFGFFLRDVGTFFTLAGGGMSLPSLRGTLAALMGGALDDPAVAGTTVPGDLVAEVLGWDLESLALGEERGGVKGCQEKLFRHTGTGRWRGFGSGGRVWEEGTQTHWEVVIACERCVVMGVLVMEVVAEDVVHAGVSGDETGREVEDVEEGDTVEAVDVAVSAWGWVEEVGGGRLDTGTMAAISAEARA